MLRIKGLHYYRTSWHTWLKHSSHPTLDCGGVTIPTLGSRLSVSDVDSRGVFSGDGYTSSTVMSCALYEGAECLAAPVKMMVQCRTARVDKFSRPFSPGAGGIGIDADRLCEQFELPPSEIARAVLL